MKNKDTLKKLTRIRHFLTLEDDQSYCHLLLMVYRPEAFEHLSVDVLLDKQSWTGGLGLQLVNHSTLSSLWLDCGQGNGTCCHSTSCRSLSLSAA